MDNERITIKISDAVAAGKDKEGNILKIPVFDSIKEIDGEL